MRILLDEALPTQLAKHFDPSYENSTVHAEGWTGTKNGALLRAARQAGFEVFVTADQGLPFQQNLAKLKIAVVVIRAASNRLEHLLPLIPSVLDAVDSIQEGEVCPVPTQV